MKFSIFQDERGEHRWHALSKNGRVVADSGEGYASKGNATKALQKFISDVCKVGIAFTLNDEATTSKAPAKKVVAKKVVAKKVVAKRAK